MVFSINKDKIVIIVIPEEKVFHCYHFTCQKVKLLIKIPTNLCTIYISNQHLYLYFVSPPNNINHVIFLE